MQYAPVQLPPADPPVPPARARPLHPGAAAGLVLLAFVAAQIVSVGVMILVFVGFTITGHISLRDLGNEQTLKPVLGHPIAITMSAAATGGTLLLAAAIVSWFRKAPLFQFLEIAKPRALDIALSVLVVLFAGPFADLAIRFVHWAAPGWTLGVLETIGSATKSGGILIVLLYLGVCAMPGVAEEVFFRGLVQRSFVSRMGVVGGIALASLVFGAFHVDPPQAAGAAVLGAALGYVAHRTKNIVPAMVAHAANNALSLTASRYDETDPKAPIPPIDFVVLGVATVLLAAALFALVRTTRDRAPH